VPFSLLTVAIHAATPALLPGDQILLCVGALAARMEVHVPATPLVLRRVASAVRAKALVPPGPPSWDEIEADVMARRELLLARLDRELARRHTPRSHRLAS
jgi:hypothetical protein